jgi:uncharacterized membrane protein YdfJ with MMPL/SSD domain
MTQAPVPEPPVTRRPEAYGVRTVLLLLLCAMLAFGGSFTCFASSGDTSDFPTTRP